MRTNPIAPLLLFSTIVLLAGCTNQKSTTPSQSASVSPTNPPPIDREFRGVWVATVGNIDWPSKPGLTTGEQQREALAILDKCYDLHLNVVVFQVRTSADALYDSPYEPWSEFLTGRQGQPPMPYYDPLEFWVAEAHRRGIELHAWFNPFRAKVPDAKGDRAANHVSRVHPEWVKDYGKYKWMDPGEKGAREYSLKVVLDVVRRYDVDGVHIDDYFYPYPEKGPDGKQMDFPDEPSWQRYLKSGGKLSRPDWRRDNINRLIEDLYKCVHREKQWVKFGISPFGIWQPGYPKEVAGFNQFGELYADAKLWLNKGWCDYFTPQLYWKISATSQPYEGLLGWWVEQNWKKRYIVPGNFTSRVMDKGTRHWDAHELIDQIAATRKQQGAQGNIHFSMKALMKDQDLSRKLAEGPYAKLALAPAWTWLDDEPPATPKVWTAREGEDLRISWEPAGRRPWLWVLYTRRGDEWRAAVYPGNVSTILLRDDTRDGRPQAVAVSAVDRSGNESLRTFRTLLTPKPATMVAGPVDAVSRRSGTVAKSASRQKKYRWRYFFLALAKIC